MNPSRLKIFILASVLLAALFVSSRADAGFTNTASMNTARVQHTATLLGDGRVLVTGGAPFLTNTEVYDPATAKWTLTAPMHFGRDNHTATLLNNGKVLVAGVPATAELYDPAKGIWTTTGDLFVTS